MSLRVKEEPGSAGAGPGEPVLRIKDEAGWSDGLGLEPRCIVQESVELGHYLPFDGTNTFCECVKTEPACSPSEWADLYAEHTVKDELVLGPECVQRPRARDVPGECFYPRVPSAESARAPAVGAEPSRGSRRARRGCSARLERGPHRRVPPPRTPRTPRTPRARGSDRGTSLTHHSDIEDELYTTIDYDRDPTCDLCGRRFALKADLMRHVVVHIHTPAGTEQDEGRGSDQSSEEEIDVVSLDPGQLPLAAARLRTAAPPQRGRPRRPAARARPPPAARAAALRRRRARRSNTNTDTDSEAPEIKRRLKYKNDKERLRRSGLKNLFDELRKQIPATRSQENAAKIVILRGAVSLCRRLRALEADREWLKNRLRTKSRKLRSMVASLRPW